MKLYLAGLSQTPKAYRELGSLYNLESYYWLRNKKEIDKNILLDSGAFSFMTSRKGEEIDFEQYVNEYADFIIKNEIDLFFELDIDVLVGIEEVERLRKILEDKTGKKSIPVWHKSRGLEYWKRMCRDYDYVAIGGIAIKEITKADYKYFPELLKIAEENNCKVHALGFTNLKLAYKYRFYSVDSTSFASGTRFGTVYHFNGKEMTSLNGSKIDKRVAPGQGPGLNLHNVKEWIKYQKYLDKIK